MYFHAIQLNKDAIVGPGSMITDSIVKIPTAAKHIKFLSKYRPQIGHYEIGNNYHKNKFLKSSEVLDSILKIIYKELKESQQTQAKLKLQIAKLTKEKTSMAKMHAKTLQDVKNKHNVC